MTLSSVLLRAVQQQQLGRRPIAPVPPPATVRRFSVWSGSTIAPQHRTVEDLAIAVYALLPRGAWDEVELLLKAGEGGTFQAAFDSHPLAPKSAWHLATLVAEARAYALRITPYVVTRGRAAWIGDEQRMISECVRVAGRCVLNTEPGAPYWNGGTDPASIRQYVRGCAVAPTSLEVCLIPRQEQVNELGGPACIQAWTDPTLVGGASFECYGLSAGIPGPTSLLVDEAIPRLDGWGAPADPKFKIPVVQRGEIGRWAETPWCAAGMQVWYLDGS